MVGEPRPARAVHEALPRLGVAERPAPEVGEHQLRVLRAYSLRGAAGEIVLPRVGSPKGQHARRIRVRKTI